MALGMVMQLPEEADETSVSRTQLLAKLDVCMGGRVAEELIFGDKDVTTGASSDLEQVRNVGSAVWRGRDLAARHSSRAPWSDMENCRGFEKLHQAYRVTQDHC